MNKLLLLVFAMFLWLQTIAREGMWVPILLEKYNLEEMQQMGFRLTATDIYDINNASMKDAVILFGGGCTGELISGDGLLITNHHCGYRQIQMHSSLENDYLTNGFWAYSRSEELPNQGLTVSFLERMEDVTHLVFEGLDALTDDGQKQEKRAANIAAIERSARENGKYRALVRPFFYGNQYFLHVYKVYSDVRLVGAPPSAIGKFGGDTDNWMWPRHTGDFALFRIYAGPNNEPAPYSPDNVPFKPKKFFPISLKGIEPGDFTMVFGYPGRTTQYLPSFAVELIQDQRDPDRIAIRDHKLEIMRNFMDSDPGIRIQYASKYASVSNAWKRWQGEIVGLQRLGAVERKKAYEHDFEVWARSTGKWTGKYDRVMENLENTYDGYGPLAKAADYYSEIVLSGIEIFTLASYMEAFILQAQRQGEISSNLTEAMERQLNAFFKDFHQPLDEEMFSRLLPMLVHEVPAPFISAELLNVLSKHQGDRLTSRIYRRSILSDRDRLMNLVASGDAAKMKTIEKDPVFSLYKSLRNFYNEKIDAPVREIEGILDAEMQHYLAGIMEMQQGKALFPDANSTLRVAYGRIEGYEPRDGVAYKHYTTLDGIIEKDNPDIYDYRVPARLKQLHAEKDYGRYGVDGIMPVCFVASNHTTGGNSGSPVLNADGHLIGINFDRCWEGTMSDIMYDPNQSRNISLDMRYMLFIVDKFAGAGYLLEEMELIF